MKLVSHDIITLLIFIGGALILSRLFAELGKRFKLPVVLGELFVGIILGPTLFGKLYPEQFHQFFPEQGTAARIALDGITQLAVVMLLFVAGLEVQLNLVLKQGKTAILTSVTSMIIPFGLGFIAAWFFPKFFNMGANDHLIYALFFGIAMAVSALPVIARILMDLGLYKTKVGMTIMAAAVFDDLVGWLTFSFVLSMMNVEKREISNIWQSAGLILGFGLFMLVIGKRIINFVLPWMQKKMSWPGGVLALCFGFGFLGAAFTESIGLHAILGAFIVGIAIGDSVHFREEARTIIHQFVMSIFAPLFFVSIGLKVNFVENFDLSLVLLVLFLAMVCKIIGGYLGAWMGGMARRDALAVGFGLNARGVMEIILGTIAHDAGLIDNKMLVALIIMALLTSLISGPMMRRFVGGEAKLA